MTEELVTLETAKLLKEKGFNEYCKYIINDKGLTMEIIIRTSNLPKAYYSRPMQSTSGKRQKRPGWSTASAARATLERCQLEPLRPDQCQRQQQTGTGTGKQTTTAHRLHRDAPGAADRNRQRRPKARAVYPLRHYFRCLTYTL